jgi:hypothetical protein
VLTPIETELRDELRATFRGWTHSSNGDTVLLASRNSEHPYQPPTLPPSWDALLRGIQHAFAEHGIERGPLLPLRGVHETDYTISAIQALDPHLKQCQPTRHPGGYLPQPVVRFTGKKDATGTLLPGFLTSFVNISCVQPIRSVAQHVYLIDAWISVLSQIGLHARHLRISGRLATWRRREVAGITLKFRHGTLELGDAVLLWNHDNPTFMATDIGSGLERLRWAISRHPWPETVFGQLASEIPLRTLDAIRTAVLITGSGITPAARGPGSALRRLIRDEITQTATTGISRVVRWAHRYWSRIEPLPVPWPEACQVLERTGFGDPAD